MDFDVILQNLKKKVYHPVYLLQGEEPYYIDLISNYIEKYVLTDSEKGFNQSIFYGKDTEELTIVHTALRFPMMSEKQVVIVKEAQSLKEIEKLASYASKPMPSTILVLNYKYKSLTGKSKLLAAVKANGVVLSTKRLWENQVPSWIEKFLKQHGFTIAPQACQIMTEYLGTDLSKLANELNKLVIAVSDTKHVTVEHIEKNIGVSKEYNLLELQNALAARNILKANRIVSYFGANPNQHSIQATVAILFGFFSKAFMVHFLKNKAEAAASKELGVHSYYMKSIMVAAKNYTPAKLYEIIGILREYDLKSKGMGVSGMVTPAELHKELIYKILH